MNLKNITNKQIDTLLKICTENSNQAKRWDALKNHPISKELDITTAKDFRDEKKCNPNAYCSVDTLFAYYNRGGADPSVIVERSELHGEYIGYDYIRWALSDDPNTEWNFEKGRTKKIPLWDRPSKISSNSTVDSSTQPSWENNPNPLPTWPETFGKVIVFGFFGLIGLVILMVVITVVEDDGGQQTQTLDLAGRVDRCVEGLRIEESCRADPEFTYCSLTEENILGSGCTSRVRTAANPANFCIAGVRPTVRRTCMIQIAGCAAVTGNPNDPSCR